MLVTKAKPAPLRNCTLRPYIAATTQTISALNIANITAHLSNTMDNELVQHNLKELNTQYLRDRNRSNSNDEKSSVHSNANISLVSHPNSRVVPNISSTLVATEKSNRNFIGNVNTIKKRENIRNNTNSEKEISEYRLKKYSFRNDNKTKDTPLTTTTSLESSYSLKSEVISSTTNRDEMNAKKNFKNRRNLSDKTIILNNTLNFNASKSINNNYTKNKMHFNHTKYSDRLAEVGGNDNVGRIETQNTGSRSNRFLRNDSLLPISFQLKSNTMQNNRIVRKMNSGSELLEMPSTMELECVAGYDGGLPQYFFLEAYDSRTKKLRLNITSALNDIPLFRIDLAGK